MYIRKHILHKKNIFYGIYNKDVTYKQIYNNELNLLISYLCLVRQYFFICCKY